MCLSSRSKKHYLSTKIPNMFKITADQLHPLNDETIHSLLKTTILIFSRACAPYWPGIAGSGSDNSIRMPSGSCGGCNARTSGGERADKQPSRATKQQLAFNIHSISPIPSCTLLGNHPFSLSNFIHESKSTRVTQQVKKTNSSDGFQHQLCPKSFDDT